ncbi:hypothetical protein LguiB_016235 [Lonicera macranthoides]
MVLSEKPLQMDLESDSKKWVIAEIQLRRPLKPIFTIPAEKSPAGCEEECATTPTTEEARIPINLECPPAPRKLKPTSRCHCHGVKEFFNPPDLESVFLRRRIVRAEYEHLGRPEPKLKVIWKGLQRSQ